MSHKQGMAAVEMADQLRRARRRFPVTVRRVPEAGMAAARELADDDDARLSVGRDATVLVRNRPRRAAR